jgi:hypothetical protein
MHVSDTQHNPLPPSVFFSSHTSLRLSDYPPFIHTHTTLFSPSFPPTQSQLHRQHQMRVPERLPATRSTIRLPSPH